MNKGEIQQRIQGRAIGVLRPDSRVHGGVGLEKSPAQKEEHGRKICAQGSCNNEPTG